MKKYRFKQLLESTMGNVRPLIMEQPTEDAQTNTMINDIEKFAKDNGFRTGTGPNKTFTSPLKYPQNENFAKYTVHIIEYTDGDVNLCVSSRDTGSSCNVYRKTYKNADWDLNTFTSTVKQYMV